MNDNTQLFRNAGRIYGLDRAAGRVIPVRVSEEFAALLAMQGIKLLSDEYFDVLKAFRDAYNDALRSRGHQPEKVFELRF